jgi:hypothetical protein
MARQPDGDERFLLADCTGDQRKRVFVRELAEYLGHPLVRLMKFARRTGLLHYAPGGLGRMPIPYVTEYGAQRVIAYCRVVQGAVYVQGKDYHAIAAHLAQQNAIWHAAAKARQRAAAEAHANRLALMAAVVVADPDGE